MSTERHRILVTGSRMWPRPEIILEALSEYIKNNPSATGYTLIHGDAPGADSMAAWAAEELFKNKVDIEIEVHPANWSKYGHAAGPIRNKEMVDLGANVCLAFQRGNSSGTANCIKLADDVGIPVLLTALP